MPHVSRILCLGLLSGVSLACGPAPPVGPPNILLISLDTLRADHLGCYGYERETTPFLDELAARGTLFRYAFANANGTDASHATMLSSHYVETHGLAWEPALHEDGAVRVKQIPSEIPLVQEVLRENGYATVGVTEGGLISGRFGFARGFDAFDDKVKNVLTGANRLLQMIHERADGEKPIFAFLHTYQVHSPYTPPVAYRSRFGRFESKVRPTSQYLLRVCRNASETFGEDDWRFLESQYDGELRYADDKLRELFSELRKLGFLDNSLVIVTADHGEEFGEHGSCLHWSKLYDELLHVPLIVAGSGVPEGQVVERLVSLVDIVPTILAAAGVGKDLPLAGNDLLALPSRATEDEVVFAQQSTVLYSVRTRDWKLIERRHPATQIELYDLREDPRELENLAQSRPERVAALQQILMDWQDRTLSMRATGIDTVLDEEQLERLRELGYVE